MPSLAMRRSQFELRSNGDTKNRVSMMFQDCFVAEFCPKGKGGHVSMSSPSIFQFGKPGAVLLSPGIHSGKRPCQRFREL